MPVNVPKKHRFTKSGQRDALLNSLLDRHCSINKASFNDTNIVIPLVGVRVLCLTHASQITPIQQINNAFYGKKQNARNNCQSGGGAFLPSHSPFRAGCQAIFLKQEWVDKQGCLKVHLTHASNIQTKPL